MAEGLLSDADPGFGIGETRARPPRVEVYEDTGGEGLVINIGDVPEGDVPEDAGPGDAAPEAVVPEDAAPEDVAPEDVAPEDVAPEAVPEDEEDWLTHRYRPATDERETVRSPAGVELSDQGIDPRNLLDETGDSLDRVSKFLNQMIEPYKQAANKAIEIGTGGRVTWEDVYAANQAAGNVILAGVSEGINGFLDATGEMAELLEERMPLGFIVWDDDGIRYQDTRPEDYKHLEIPQLWTEPETLTGQVGASIIQFVSMMALMSFGTLGTIPHGMLRWTSIGAVADSLFDPEEGNFSTQLMEWGLWESEAGEPNVVLEWLGTPIGEDAGAAERLAFRLKTAIEGSVIAAPFDIGFVLFKAFKVLKENPVLKARAIEYFMGSKESRREYFQGAKKRWDEGKGPIPLGMSIEEVSDVDPLLAAAVRAVHLREQPIRSEGGVSLSEAKTNESLRLHQKRIENMNEKGASYPGAPKNPRIVIKAPEGSGLPDVVIGAATPDDWRIRIETAMTPEEIHAASKWYDHVYDEFNRVTGGNEEESRKLAKAWLSAQQNASPEAALDSVIQIYEQVQRGVPVAKLKGTGLPGADAAAIAAILKTPIKSGVGQKISDFIDSADNKNVRTIMNNDPSGGSPFVVDVHTGRDTGLVDQEYINHLTRLGYDVPDGVIRDLAGGGIKGAQYENRVLFGHQLTDHLNDMNWMGRSDWEPREIQAIGWGQLTRMYGDASAGGDVVGAVQRSTRRISMEVDPGEGSPWALKYGDDYKALDEPARYAINEQVTARAVDLVNEREGINLSGIVHGTGGWELYTNPSTVQQGVISRGTARSAAARLAYYLNQTEVWVNSAKGMTKAPAHYGIDIVEDGSQNLRDTDKLLELWEAIVEADPTGLIRGYQPIEDMAGNVGIKIIVDHDAMKAWAVANKSNLAGAREAVNEFFTRKLDDITEGLDYDVRHQLNEIELDKVRNNWTEAPDGQSHLENIRDAGRSSDPAQGGTDIDLDRAELEKLFGDLIAEGRGSGTRGLGEEGVPSQQQATRPLKGLEAAAYGPNPEIETLAAQYAGRAGIPYARQTEYAEIDPEFGARVADAYAAMKHDPSDPAVKAAYKAMGDETIAQYQMIKEAGYTIEMMRPGMDAPYKLPRDALEDLANNKHLWIYPTDFGYGPDAAKALDPATNPLLAFTDEVDVSGTPMRVNDLFRAVHDFFGHGIEGAGFRARGEENAWQAHSRLYSEEALPAVTSETRGQNSWTNFGPHGETNRTAKEAATVFAEQKVGVMPSWTWTERGRPPDIEPGAIEPKARRGKTRAEVEAQGGPLSRNVDERLPEILEEHGIKWEYHENGGITADDISQDRYGKMITDKKYFKPGTTLRTVRDWLGY